MPGTTQAATKLAVRRLPLPGTRLGTVRRLYDHCVRCGVTVPWGRSVCRACNPADLPAPSPSQYHATVYLAVLATIVLMVVFFLVRA